MFCLTIYYLNIILYKLQVDSLPLLQFKYSETPAYDLQMMRQTSLMHPGCRKTVRL